MEMEDQKGNVKSNSLILEMCSSIRIQFWVFTKTILNSIKHYIKLLFRIKALHKTERNKTCNVYI